MKKYSRFEPAISFALKTVYFVFTLALSYAARGQFNLVTNEDNTITIASYTGPSGVDVVIPDTTNGYPVVSIGDNAFFSANITSITFPSELKNIGDGAFANNFNWLSAVVIPEGVTNVGGGAFGATEVSSISVPASVATIGDGAFANAYDCGSITVNPANTNYLSSAEGVLYNRSQTRLLTYPAGRSGNYVIPTNVKDIGPFAFSGVLNLPKITIPDTVTNIENYALGNSQRLYTIVIGAGVQTLGYGVFQTAYDVTGIYFRGNAPASAGGLFTSNRKSIVYYLPGTTGWAPLFDIAPTELWNPQTVQPKLQSGTFGFDIIGSTNLFMGVQVCTNLANPAWSEISQIQLTAQGAGHFDDPDGAALSACFYRLTPP